MAEDFTIETLASYLHLEVSRVARLAERGRLPGRKVGGLWRFPEAEIHHWLEDKIGAADDDELARMEGALERADQTTEQETLCVSGLLPAGAVAVPLLPVAQFPHITPPTVRVQASYPGASAEVVENSVTIPLEQQINGVEGMLYMSSNSANDGSSTITVTFEVGYDQNIAAVDVQNRIAVALPQLPDESLTAGDVLSRPALADPLEDVLHLLGGLLAGGLVGPLLPLAGGGGIGQDEQDGGQQPRDPDYGELAAGNALRRRLAGVGSTYPLQRVAALGVDHAGRGRRAVGEVAP